MGWLALSVAVMSGACLALSSPGMFLAMGLSGAAGALGLLAYRRRSDGAGSRLAGAGALTVGAMVLALSSAKYALTLAALDKVISVLSG